MSLSLQNLLVFEITRTNELFSNYQDYWKILNVYFTSQNGPLKISNQIISHLRKLINRNNESKDIKNLLHHPLQKNEYIRFSPHDKGFSFPWISCSNVFFVQIQQKKKRKCTDCFDQMIRGKCRSNMKAFNICSYWER